MKETSDKSVPEQEIVNGKIKNAEGKWVFAPGHSGNPAGKPKGSKHLTTLLFDALLERAKDENGNESKNTYSDLLIKRILNDAIVKGNSSMIHLIVNYIDGLPQQGIDITTDGEKIGADSIDVIAIARKVSAELKEQKTTNG